MATDNFRCYFSFVILANFGLNFSGAIDKILSLPIFVVSHFTRIFSLQNFVLYSSALLCILIFQKSHKTRRLSRLAVYLFNPSVILAVIIIFFSLYLHNKSKLLDAAVDYLECPVMKKEKIL